MRATRPRLRFSPLKLALIAAVFGFCTLGCGGGGLDAASRPLLVFPDEARLDEIAAEPVPELATQDAMLVDRWTFTDEDMDAPSPWTRVLRESAPPPSEGGGLRLDGALGCLAREAARFFHERQAQPDAAFVTYTTARCGSALPGAGLYFLGIDTANQASDAKLAADLFASDAAQGLRDALPKGPSAGGIAFHRGQDGKGTLCLAFGEEQAQVKLEPRQPDDADRLILNGKLRTSTGRLKALINQGEHGVAQCSVQVSHPSFRIICPMAREDETAWVDVLMLSTKALLARSVARVLAHRGALPETYEAPHGSGAVDDPNRYRHQLEKRLSERRSSADLAAVPLSRAQSSVSDKLTPHLLKAQADGDDDRSNEITLGLLAGHRIDGGIIRDGSIYFALEDASRDPERWLELATQFPMGRSVLLAPDAKKLALGLHFTGKRSVAVVANTYEFYEPGKQEQYAKAFLAALERQRAGTGLSAPVRVTDLSELSDAAARVRQGKLSPGQALEQAGEAASQRYQQALWLFVLETFDLDFAELPDELLQAEPLRIAVEVTHHRPEGAAWGQHAVLVIALAGEATTSAGRGR